jgi:hypothetical protein
MAINKNTVYGTRVDNSDPEYQYGKAINIVGAVQGTGTPYEEDLINEDFGFQEALLKNSNQTPSGNVENRSASQYYQAVQESAGGRATTFKIAAGSNSNSVTLEPFQSYQQEPGQLFEGMVVKFKKTLAINAGASLTIQGSGVGSITINSSTNMDETNLVEGTDTFVELMLVDYQQPSQNWKVISNGISRLTNTYRPAIEEYSSSKTYNLGEKVFDNDAIYTSLVGSNVNNTPSASPAQWSQQDTGDIKNSSYQPGPTVTDALNTVPLFRTGSGTSTTDSAQVFNFSSAFPNNCHHVSITIIDPDNLGTLSLAAAPTTSSFTIDRSSGLPATVNFTYMAIGD